MKRREIKRKFAEIVSFAEVEQFVDTPVKHYSSGMYMRLAFSVAAHLESEILLVDEVLAVGDAEFQQKCVGKMENVADEGRVVLFVSHNMAAIQGLCTKGCLIDDGQLTAVGDVQTVIGRYRGGIQDRSASLPLAQRTDRCGNGGIRFIEARLLNGREEIVNVAASGEPLIIILRFVREFQGGQHAVVCLRFSDDYGQDLFQCLSRISCKQALRLPPAGEIRCIIPRLPLIPGRYTVGIWCKIDNQVADRIDGAINIDVAAADFFRTGKQQPMDGGRLLVDHSWNIQETSQLDDRKIEYH
jgi:lipopolysaccharide transport system ATP-binding protein